MESPLQTIFILILPFILALTLHEVAHARAAFYFGDRTALQMGRFSLNPLRHIDLFGTIILPLMLFFGSGGKFAFGFLKPVPVNFANLRNPKAHMGLVALAGPAANFAQAFFWMIFARMLPTLFPASPKLALMAIFGVQINLAICAINLLPLPPLDGGRILISVLPDKQGKLLSKLEPYGLFIVLGLVLLQSFSSFSLIDSWVMPVTQLLMKMISSLASLFFPF